MRIGITVNDIALEFDGYTTTHLAMTATNLSTFVLQMIFGIVLVLAVLFNAVVSRRS